MKFMSLSAISFFKKKILVKMKREIKNPKIKPPVKLNITNSPPIYFIMNKKMH